MMAATIPDAIRPRLGQFVRLLASDQPGEVVAAAAALRRALAGVGADFHDLAGAIEHPAVVVVERPESAPQARRSRKSRADHGHIAWTPSHRHEVRETLEHGLARLNFNGWERDFITSIIDRLRDPRGRLTFRQAEVVDRLVAKIEGRR